MLTANSAMIKHIDGFSYCYLLFVKLMLNIISLISQLNLMQNKYIRLGEQIPLIQFLDNSRAIIQECLGGFGWLKNLVEMLCPPTYSPSLIKTG